MRQSCKDKTGIIAIGYLLSLLILSLLLKMPVKSIFPYLIPVIIISARCGWRAGFFLSVLATGIAWLGQAFPTVPENTGLEFEEVLITLTELVLAAVVSSAVARKITGFTNDKLYD
ncbi:MAG: hypothetical protein WBJ21_07980 [Burkholderiaceae bacterium]